MTGMAQFYRMQVPNSPQRAELLFTINALFQFRSHLEKRQALGLDHDHFPAFGVASLAAIVLLDFEGIERIY